MKNTKKQQYKTCPRCGKRKLRIINQIDWKICEVVNTIKQCDFCKFQNIANVVWENDMNNTSIISNNNKQLPE